MHLEWTVSSARTHAAWFIGTVLGLGLASTSAAGPADARWMLHYAGHSTNAAIGDPKMADTLAALLPAPLAEQVTENFAGPPGPVLSAGSDIVLSACRAHDCGDKAFLWVDTAAGTALGAVAACPGLIDAEEVHRWNGCRLELGSRTGSDETVSREARQALLAWLADEDLKVEQVSFLGGDGVRRALDPASYRVPARFRPSSSGPSFDCSAARTDVDRAICADPGLAALDLKLDALYDQIRRGVSDEPARDELRDLERGWVRHRDEACAAEAGRTACLSGQYRSQIDRLGHWMPARRVY